MIRDSERINEAINIIGRYGNCDGGSHKQWVLDQVLRVLLGDEYEDWRCDYSSGGEYEWDEGVPP